MRRKPAELGHRLGRSPGVPVQNPTDRDFGWISAWVRLDIRLPKAGLAFIRKALVERIVHERGIDLGAVCDVVIQDHVTINHVFEAPDHPFASEVSVTLSITTRESFGFATRERL